jgi:hypothetical protein
MAVNREAVQTTTLELMPGFRGSMFIPAASGRSGCLLHLDLHAYVKLGWRIPL